MSDERPVHILDRVSHSRDPDARSEAVSLCNSWEECSGSGRHGMVRGKDGATCEECLHLYDTAPAPEDWRREW